MFRNAKRFSLHLLLLVGFVLVSAKQGIPQDKPDVRLEIANTYGFASWGNVEQIRYTFNVDAGKVKVARTWTWEPKMDHVTFEGKDKEGKSVKVSYMRGQMAPEVVKNTDPDFINDQYWLLFPFHLVWDKNATVKAEGRHVTVTYPKSGGGYTPGDSYELFLGADNRITKWVYHEGGTPKPSLTTTWGDYKMAGPIPIAHDHRGVEEGKPIRIFFTDVAVKLSGSDAWVAAK
jgi:hypothetical protein